MLIKCSKLSILIAGNYSCVPSYATPAWVLVTVIPGVFKIYIFYRIFLPITDKCPEYEWRRHTQNGDKRYKKIT